MKYIDLTQGKRAVVDDDDYKRLNAHKWYAWLDCGRWRARRSVYLNGKQGAELLARVVVGAKKGDVVDHINGETLDNRKSNLRIVDNYINQQNRTKVNKNNSLKEKNISFDGVRYLIQFMKNRKRYNYNSRTIKEAIKIRDNFILNGIPQSTEGDSK